MVMDVVGRLRRRTDKNCPHPKRVGHGEIAGIVLEHGTLVWCQTIESKDGLEGS